MTGKKVSSSALSSHGFSTGTVACSWNSFLEQPCKVLHVHLSRYFPSSFWQTKQGNTCHYSSLGPPKGHLFRHNPGDSDSSFVLQWVTPLQSYNLLSNRICNIQSCRSDKSKIQYFLTHQSSQRKSLYCLREDIPSFCT